jgi:tellurite methyltransferase
MSDFDRDKWNAKYSDSSFAPTEPSAVLTGLVEYLPSRGRAIDIAGGAGRNAIWLAKRGLDTTLADISAVGLEVARERVAALGVKIKTLEIDLEQQPLPAGPFDVISCICYLGRHLFPQFPPLLASQGTLIVVQPTKRNLERNDKPPFDFLYDEGELRSLAGDLEIVHYYEGWSADDRHDAVLVARKPPSPVV